MSLFSFANISFGSKSRKIDASKNLISSNEYNIYRYPIDLGSSDKGHYMVFHVNGQLRSKLVGSSQAVNDRPTIIDNKIAFGVPNAAQVGIGFAGATRDEQIRFVRTIRRVKDTMALYMPDTLMFKHNQGYSDVGLTGLLAAGIATATQGQSMLDTVKNPNSDVMDKIVKIAGNFSPIIATQIKNNALLSAGFTAYSGLVVNPMLEMIYTSPSFREFRFDFVFHPRSEKEAMEVQNIINRFYFHQAPEIYEKGAGFFLIPPSEFDILFYYNGGINPNIPKISTCVLTNVDVNYAPSGFAAYEVQGQVTPEPGKTGMPVSITLSLNFKETEIMTKDNFKMKTDGNNATGAQSMETIINSNNMFDR